MLFVAALAAAVAVVVIQYFLYKKRGFEQLVYSATLSSSEVFVGDDVYLYEELTNRGRLPLPYVKVDTDLPDGLVFTLLDAETDTVDEVEKYKRSLGAKRGVEKSAPIHKKEKDKGLRSVHQTGSIQSVFVLRPYARVRRRWRVTCKKRGEYSLGGVIVTGNDILGLLPRSKRLEPEDNRRNFVTVLPQPEPLDGQFSSSRYLCGDVITELCPVTDPIRICGAREYTPLDPMNRINWKSTAAHGTLMVNIEEKTVRHRFSLLLNMNSREIEQFADTPSDTAGIERCITTCTSILDRIAAEDVPVKLFANYPPAELEGAEAVCGDEVGGSVAVCGPYRGSRDMIYALRMLAKLKMKISVPAEKMFDHIATHPELYSEYENLIIVSSYIDGRMLNLRAALAPAGVRVLFYVVTPRNHAGVLPDDADVFFAL